MINILSNRKKYPYSSPSGFTLIELLISIFITGLVFTIGFASYREFSSRQSVDAVTRGFKSDLRLAQQMAAAGKKPTDTDGTVSSACSADSGNELNAYRVVRVSTQSYQIVSDCSGGTEVVKTVDLSTSYPNIQISDFGTIFFFILSKGTSVAATLKVDITDGINTSSVSITSAGEVN